MYSWGKTLLFMATLAGSTGACDRTEVIGPQRYLYGRWQQVAFRLANGSVFRTAQNRLTIVPFKPSGEYVYEFNGRQLVLTT